MFQPIGFGIGIAFFAILGQTIFSGVFGLYAITKFNYGPEQVGIILMSIAFVYAFAQGFAVGPLTRKFGERKIMTWAVIGCSIGFGLILLAQSFMYLLIAVSCFIFVNSLLKPSALAYVSTRTNLSMGKSMGIAESYMSLGRILGPLWAGLAFDVNYYYPFLSGGIIFFLIFILIFVRDRLIPNLQSNTT